MASVLVQYSISFLSSVTSLLFSSQASQRSYNWTCAWDSSAFLFFNAWREREGEGEREGEREREIEREREREREKQ